MPTSFATRFAPIRRHGISIAAALSAVLAVGFSVGNAAPATTRAVPTASGPALPFRDFISGAGLVESATRDIMVAAPVAGIVEAVHVSIGQHVTAGTPLITLDQRAARAEVAQRLAALQAAQAEHAERRASLSQAEVQLARAEAIGDPRALSGEELVSRRAGVAMAIARLASAEATIHAREAELEAAETARAQRVVRAPRTSEVLAIEVRPGEYTAGGAVAPVRLGVTDRLHVRVDIDENDAWQVRVGARAELRMRGNGARTTPLRFEYIERYVKPKTALTGASTERVDTRVLQVVYSFPADAVPLYVGQQVDVLIEVAAPSRSTP